MSPDLTADVLRGRCVWRRLEYELARLLHERVACAKSVKVANPRTAGEIGSMSHPRHLPVQWRIPAQRSSRRDCCDRRAGTACGVLFRWGDKALEREVRHEANAATRVVVAITSVSTPKWVGPSSLSLSRLGQRQKRLSLEQRRGRGQRCGIRLVASGPTTEEIVVGAGTREKPKPPSDRRGQYRGTCLGTECTRTARGQQRAHKRALRMGMSAVT